MTTRSSNLFSRPLHGLNLGSAPIPEINRWAIFKPSAKRGLSGTISLGIAEGLRLSEPKVLILLAGGSAFSGLFVRATRKAKDFAPSAGGRAVLISASEATGITTAPLDLAAKPIGLVSNLLGLELNGIVLAPKAIG